jgi:hypothetical protein
MFFGCKDDKLYYSDVAFVNNWSPYFFIDFDTAIIGIGSTQNGLLVFTKDKTYIVTGSTPNSLSKLLLHGTQGCLNHKTIKYVDNALIWLSADGLCTSAGGAVNILTMSKLGFLNVEPIDSAIWNDKYYLFHTTGTLVADFTFSQPIFSDINIVANGVWYSSIFDKLYYVNTSGDLYSLLTGATNLTYSYKTGRLTEGSITVLKNYKTFYIYCYGTTELKIYIDGALVITKNLVAGLNEIKSPQDLRLGYYLELEFNGTGEVAEVEYKVEMRQNGR